MLLEELKNKDIILASGSPRRKQLLQSLGIDFRIEKPEVSENYPPGLEREEIALYIAVKKAEAVIRGKDAGQIIIASDTIVCIDDRVLNKPAGREDAVQMLKQLSGNEHFVITAVCLADSRKMRSFFSETKVRFAELLDQEIEYYIDRYQPWDKAGAYGIQEWIGYTGIEWIEGSYFNVMGLPVQKLYDELKKFIKE
ncbi:MAG: Maf family nucleotide pyrophosphatase [Bacteroidales bacterium]|nr:Maf family nucleotide pyrophosphatase [Bacteroidales bacterium]